MPIKPLYKLGWQQDSSLNMSFNTSETNDSTEPSTFQFPELTLPQRDQSITTFAQLVAYFDRRPPELRAAFKTTYNITDSLEPSNSLLEFLDKWAKCKNPIYHDLTKEFPEEFFPKLFTILNIEANLMGLVLLASLYPCFRENHLNKFDTQIEEETIARDFMKVVRFWNLYKGGYPFQPAWEMED